MYVSIRVQFRATPNSCTHAVKDLHTTTLGNSNALVKLLKIMMDIKLLM